MKRTLSFLFLFCLSAFDTSDSFLILSRNGFKLELNHNLATQRRFSLASSRRSNDDDKFSFGQRIESVKTGALGALAGGIASAPFIAFHDISAYGLASWEFDTDMGAIQSALFAIVYRYCVRKNDKNDMLNMGVIGAFVVVRTLSRVRVPGYCTAAPLDCGDPFGYFDWDMIQQLLLNGLESVALFGAAAAAMEVAYARNWISKFPN
ncbi:hypothetical protein ACHAW6_002194 [Cyclotella cf. meneghiniana]